MKKADEAEKFLKSLENAQTTFSIMTSRIDIPTLYVIKKFANLIAKSQKNKESFSLADMLESSLIVGYLLRSHVERYELEQLLAIED